MCSASCYHFWYSPLCLYFSVVASSRYWASTSFWLIFGTSTIVKLRVKYPRVTSQTKMLEQIWLEISFRMSKNPFSTTPSKSQFSTFTEWCLERPRSRLSMLSKDQAIRLPPSFCTSPGFLSHSWWWLFFWISSLQSWAKFRMRGLPAVCQSSTNTSWASLLTDGTPFRENLKVPFPDFWSRHSAAVVSANSSKRKPGRSTSSGLHLCMLSRKKKVKSSILKCSPRRLRSFMKRYCSQILHLMRSRMSVSRLRDKAGWIMLPIGLEVFQIW